MTAVVGLLADDAVLISDGGPRRRAARRPVLGPERVGRFLVNVASRLPPDAEILPVAVNAQPGVVVRADEVLMVVAFEVVHGRVCAIHLIAAPEKLAALRSTPRIA